ncbi:uncharacterized protein LOC134717973 [Mytilus trossulus]|uniref:uncharacterized protein LOC134717973 n=1 Tax=Mytilus trossulus TaxID=6551 RepID=UPI0030073D1C
MTIKICLRHSNPRLDELRYTSVCPGSGCKLLYSASCYRREELWDTIQSSSQNDNSRCKNNCKEADAKYQYSGTRVRYCYCGKTEPSAFDKVADNECTYRCPGNNEDICGGYDHNFDYNLLTVSTIDRTTETVTTGKNIQETSATAVSTRVSAMTEFMNMITSDTSSSFSTNFTPFTTHDESSTTSGNANNYISPMWTETSTQETTAEQLKIIDVEVIMPACTCTNGNGLDEEDIFHCNYQATSSENITLACQPNTRGRFVRIKCKDMESLTIREVDVNGDQVNSTNESGQSSTAYACGHSRYGFVSPIIGTSVASSYIDCTIMCFTITACAAAEYDKDANVCTLKGECTN